MKKVLILAVSSCISFMSWAQKDLQTANNYLTDKDYEHAKEYVEKVLNDPSTAKNPKAWLLKGNIYTAIQQDPKMKGSNAYREATTAFMKAAELKEGYEKETISYNVYAFSYNYYNDGVIAFNERTPAKYAEAEALMRRVVEMHDFELKQKYTVKPSFDTVAMQAKYIIGNCEYYQNKNSAAIATLTEVKNSHMVKAVDLYVHLADLYEKENKTEEKLAVIKEGEIAYPKDESFKAMEINYYIKAGKQDVLTKKLEESTAEHPDNPELWYNLGTIYMNMANPKGSTPPANAKELTSKAADAYNKAIKLDSTNVDYNYNIGAMYFNEGVEMNQKMNEITGNSAADMKKYDELKKVRQGYFAQAQPYLETSLRLLEAKGSMKKEDRVTYNATLTSLRDIYGKQDKGEKASEMTKKLQGK